MGIIYILLNFPYIWKTKIGKTTVGKLRNRRKSISGTTPGVVFPIWAMVFPFGVDRLEADLHDFLRFLRLHMPFRKGSGRTEWYFILAAIIAFVVINLMAVLYWSPVMALVWVALN